MPSMPAVTVHTGWQRSTSHTDVDARVALPPAEQLSRACTRTRAVGERQWRGDRSWPRPSDGLWCSSSSLVCRWWRRQRPAQPRLAIVRSIWLARTPSWHRWPARASPCRGRSQQRQVPVRCSGAVLLRARRNGGSYTSQISAAKGARPRDGSPSTPATQLAQQTRAAAPLVPSFWPPQPPTAELGSAQPNCRIRQFTPPFSLSRRRVRRESQNAI